MQCHSTVAIALQADVIANCSTVLTLHLARSGQEIDGRVIPCELLCMFVGLPQLLNCTCRDQCKD